MFGGGATSVSPVEAISSEEAWHEGEEEGQSITEIESVQAAEAPRGGRAAGTEVAAEGAHSHIAEGGHSAAEGATTLVAALRDLATLRSEGALTEEEFVAAKACILKPSQWEAPQIEEDGAEENSVLMRVPIINMFYDAFVKEPPTPALVRTALDTMGILSALMLTVVVSSSMNVTFDEMEEVRARFSNSTPYHSIGNFDAILQEVTGYATAALYCLGGTVVMVVVQIMFEGVESSCQSRTLRELWWYPYGLILLAMTTLQCFAGCSMAAFAYNRMVMVKYPDLLERENKGFLFPSLYGSAYGAARSWALLHLVPSIVVTIMIISLSKGAMAKHIVQEGGIRRLRRRKSMHE